MTATSEFLERTDLAPANAQSRESAVRKGSLRRGLVVRLKLTPLGARRLERLAALHLEELGRLVPKMQAIWKGLEDPGGSSKVRRRPRPTRR